MLDLQNPGLNRNGIEVRISSDFVCSLVPAGAFAVGSFEINFRHGGCTLIALS